ncbi:hypothetical protein Tco_0845045 [Tanacetum coccineum]
MDERLREMETNVASIVIDIEELTYATSGMSEQYEQFYGELGQWRSEQERTPYAYVPTIPDLGVQHGVNFMSGTPSYSTAPSPSPSTSQFGMFHDHARPSTAHQQDDMCEH